MKRLAQRIVATLTRAAAAVACGAATSAAAAGGLVVLDDPSLGTFIEISEGVGQPFPLGDDGEAFLPVSYPLSYIFVPGPIVVGINGGMSFGLGAPADLDPVNGPIPDANAFLGAQAALVYWDDIDDKEGDTFFAQLADRLIVQWNVANFDDAGGDLRFQVQIHANGGPTGIYAQFLYRITPEGRAAGAGATIGYQDGGTGFGDIEFSFDRDSVGDGTVLSFLIAQNPCAEDVDQDGEVGFVDLTELLSHWGPCAPPCASDIDGSGDVGFHDLTAVLVSWGPCA